MLGTRIAALRRDAEMSQAELAGHLGVSASAVGMYEQGRREPSAETLVALAELFGVTTDYLLTGALPTRSDREAAQRSLLSTVAAAEEKLRLRHDRPFTRQELTVLFAAMLMDT